MNCTTSPTTIPLRRLAVPVLAAAAMIFAGCGIIEIDVSQAYQPEAGS